MTHHERRELERKNQCESGDPRAVLLAATPASERSEAAARYDHRIEADDLDRQNSPTAAELESEKMSLWRATVAVALSDNAGYRDIATRYMGGHRVSAGMARAISTYEASTPFPTDDEALAAWHDGRRFRREYIRKRYGV